MDILAVFNAKGGVGKTTTAVNLAACFAAMGQKVLLIDLDAQGNATTGLGMSELPPRGTFDIITGNATLEEVRLSTFMEGLTLIGATNNLAAVDIELSKADRRHDLIRQVVSAHKDTIDIVVMDCPPSFGVMTINALVSAHAVLVPSPPTPFAHDGLLRTWTIISRMRTTMNHSLRVIGVLPNFLHGGESKEDADAVTTACDADILSAMKAEFGDLVHPEGIPLNTELFTSAASKGVPACVLAPDSAPGRAYLDVAGRIIPAEGSAGTDEHAKERSRFRCFGQNGRPDALVINAAAEKLARWHIKADALGLLSRNINIPGVDENALGMIRPKAIADDGASQKVRYYTLALAFIGVTLLAGVIGFLAGWFFVDKLP
ncbi:MAG: hypothetical protein A3G18_13235 [Rhodospirillales bacterium RIFCSPLOWO2_12_FULL_58_28]|nr:MAG: hypothetical protein A3H92_13090 [Rhodospirillales bacterium RIFCSPLOWO2_02_FULL_58_16]OHC78542.1 MAG: hypothetical protein A3G18_13235 [Rhodospirillales bacterium RIFCSPLOWO2_12_FULL_58_28]